MLIVGRESGLLQRYNLPSVSVAGRYNINTKPYKININCNSRYVKTNQEYFSMVTEIIFVAVCQSLM
jgi:hypothetical protein